MMQSVYGGVITEIDDLWTDESITALKTNVPDLIRRLRRYGKSKIHPFFQNVVIYCPQFDDPRQLSTVIAHVKLHAQPYVTLQIAINLWHFKPEFNPSNFNDIQLGTPFATVLPMDSPTPAAAGNMTTPQAIAIALITALGITPAAVTPGNATDHSKHNTPTGGNLAQELGQLFSPTTLPVDTKERFTKAKFRDVMLTKTDQSAYVGTQPNIAADPSGNTMHKILYYMDGPHHLINCSGELFYFSKYDERNSKTFILCSLKNHRHRHCHQGNLRLVEEVDS